MEHDIESRCGREPIRKKRQPGIPYWWIGNSNKIYWSFLREAHSFIILDFGSTQCLFSLKFTVQTRVHQKDDNILKESDKPANFYKADLFVCCTGIIRTISQLVLWLNDFPLYHTAWCALNLNESSIDVKSMRLNLVLYSLIFNILKRKKIILF